ESLILADESLILVNESLILADESLILVNESLNSVNQSLILADESLNSVNQSLNSTPRSPCSPAYFLYGIENQCPQLNTLTWRGIRLACWVIKCSVGGEPRQIFLC
ncbi:MAG: hypothetical protein V7K65_06775, partial [Nostoc sp.]